jgi:hypothetical protein
LIVKQGEDPDPDREQNHIHGNDADYKTVFKHSEFKYLSSLICHS